MPRLQGHATALGINMALGALTAGVADALRGGSIWKAAATGAGAGAVGYAGKVMVTADFAGSGFLGRQVAAVGTSVLSNTASGRGAVEELVLPWGPFRVELTRTPYVHVRTRVDVPSLAYTAYRVSRPHTAVDWSETFASGAIVLVDDGEVSSWVGRHAVGVITLKRDSEAFGRARRRVLQHERVHLLQHDFTYAAWGRPVEAWLLKKSPTTERMHAHLDFRLDLLGWLAMSGMMAQHDRLSEREAYFLVPIPRPGTPVDVINDQRSR